MTEKEEHDISRKLNVLIALSLRQLLGDTNFGPKTKRNQGAGDLARYLASMGLDAKDIAEILGSPVQSIRTLLTPKRRK
ncbi:MAG TPA: hypothetical protein VHB20_19365 [Verrucomicrobiae bacterium]|jgi:hypothetical protein|nr:hypothetical protein [Verrucomicrobiae bacterium]